MLDNPDSIDIFLQPGDYFVGDASFRIRTLLGSCVSITLWHRQARIGAMSHFMLPGRSGGAEPDARYGDDALALMVAELFQNGVRASQCEAKIFGGGNMFPAGRRDRPGIGVQNGDAARRLLSSYAIEVVAESLFGSGHRQIVFEIGSGDVWMRQIASTGSMQDVA